MQLPIKANMETIINLPIIRIESRIIMTLIEASYSFTGNIEQLMKWRSDVNDAVIVHKFLHRN